MRNLAYAFQRCTYSLLYRTDVPIHVDNVESSGDSIRMVLERIDAQRSAEVEELGANEDRRGHITRIQQKDEAKKEIARRKRHFIVNQRKLKEDYLIFQMTRGGEAAQPKTPDPDEQWSKRQWEKAMANWRSELRRWVEMQNATKKQHGRHTQRPTAHSNVAGLSVALNARNATANCPNVGSWWVADTALQWERRKVRPSVRFGTRAHPACRPAVSALRCVLQSLLILQVASISILCEADEDKL